MNLHFNERLKRKLGKNYDNLWITFRKFCGKEAVVSYSIN